jgi:hypothetical protein
MTKAFAQRLQELQQQANGSQQMDPKDEAKIQAIMLTAKTKTDLAGKSHAQRTAQRQLQFEQQLKQDQQKHQAEIAKTDLTTAAEIRHNRMKAFTE